jgi:predicted PurR-regulated permease PerM
MSSPEPKPTPWWLMVVLALAFWTWMWGPIGAFLATPLSIIGIVVFSHLFPPEDVKLPE